MSKSGATAPESDDRVVAGKRRRRRRYDWPTLLNGERHRLVAGEDFWTSVRVFQNQVSQMAKSRGISVRTWSETEEARAKQAPKRVVWVQADTTE